MAKKLRLFSVSFLALAGTFVFVTSANAQEATRLRLDEATIKKGYTVEHDSANLRFAVTPDQVDQPVRIVLKTLDLSDRPLPEGKQVASGFYSFDMIGINSNPIIVKKPSWVAVKFASADDLSDKSLYNWDTNVGGWVQMPSHVDQPTHEVRGITHLPYSQVVVLEDKNRFEGVASWFGYSEKMAAASRDFPVGTKLTVTNLETDASIVVTVSTYGPTRLDRVIDLTTDAFKALAPLSQGTISRVKVEPYLETIASPETPTIASASAIVIDSQTGEVLWEKEKNQVRPIASLTKIMTGLVFLDTHTPFDKVVTYQANDNAEGGKLYISPGETLTTKDLFYSMLVGSANNAANALARSTGLTREEFVERMNDKAKNLGLKQTRFADPSGLSSENTSTAHDYALLSREALKFLVMLQGTTMRHYPFSTINLGKFHDIKNTNTLLNTDLYITGSKTGYTDEAYYCLMTKAKRSDSREFIAVVLGASNSGVRFAETETILRWALSQ